MQNESQKRISWQFDPPLFSSAWRNATGSEKLFSTDGVDAVSYLSVVPVFIFTVIFRILIWPVEKASEFKKCVL